MGAIRHEPGRSSAGERRLRRVLPDLAALALGLLAPVVVGEVVLRLLPVATGLAAQRVDDASPYFRFSPTRGFVYSKGWRFDLLNRGRVNNAGFVNDRDYDADRPIVAVIGDSYVEALMVPYAETVQGRLAARLEGVAEVYSFGASGAPLSQYLAWAEMARREYQPRSMIFVVVGNDFDESVLSVKRAPGFHHFDDSVPPPWPLVRIDYTPGPWRDLVRHSALARYALLNLQVLSLGVKVRAIGQPDAGANAFVGNTAAHASPQRIDQADAVIRRFLELLPDRSGLPPGRVLFLLDGARPELYREHRPAAAARAYFPRVRELFSRRARAAGFEVVDLEPRFARAHLASGVRFEFPTDGHWNSAGHALAADAAWRSRPLRDLLNE